jgi:hypothetical protein
LTALPERNVYGEIVTPDGSAISFAKLACAVKRINDPDAFGSESARIICRLFGEHGVLWARSRERGRNARLSRRITGTSKRPLV